MKQVSAQQLVVLTQALGLEGFNVQPLLKQWGLTSSSDAAMRPWRPVEELDELMRQCQAMTGDDGFGLVVSTSQAQMCHGTLAVLALHAPTLRVTLDDLGRYYAIATDRREVTYSLRDGIAVVHIDPIGLTPDTRRFRAEQTIGGLLALLRFCGLEDEDLLSVALEHAQPAYAERYRDSFGPSLKFGQPRYRLEFRSHLLDAPRVQSDASAYAVARASANAALAAAAQRTSVVEVVKRAIRPSGAEWIGMKEAAQRLGVGERTLRRQLAEQGTTYQAIFEALRIDEAKKLIALGTMPIKQVSEHAGYESVSNFNRAFKQRTGFTPVQWRSSAAAQDMAVSPTDGPFA